MNKKLVLLGATLLLTAASASAQKRVTGRVLDAEGQPVVGATVRVNGSKAVVSTDHNGAFSIANVPASAKNLTVSYIGKQSQTVSIAGNVNVTLKDNDNQLGDAYVVAYGQAKKASFTGAAAKVKGEVIENKATTDVTEALMGEVAGVQIVQSDGNPGSSSGIIIRGIGSINASATPLLIVDGMPYGGDYNQIDPKDIASLDIMKDATATALYGSRGANGVIIITTKKGQTGKLQIGADVKYSVSGRWLPTYDVIKSPERYAELSWEGIKNQYLALGADAETAASYASEELFHDTDGIPTIYNMWNADGADLIDPTTGKFKEGITRKYNPENWEDELFRTGQRVDAGVNLSGGNDRVKNYTSIGFTKDKGYVVGADFRRFTARSNADFRITNWLKGSTSLSYTNTRRNASVQESASNNALYFSNSVPYIYPVFMRDENGNKIEDNLIGGYRYDYGMEYGRPYSVNANPVGDADLNKTQTDIDFFSGNGQLEATFLTDFRFVASLGYSYYHHDGVVITNPYYSNAEGEGYIERVFYTGRDITSNEILYWKHTYNDVHHVSAFVGHEATWNKNDYSYGQKNGMVRADDNTFGNAVTYQTLTGYSYGYSLDSWFGNVSYDYADKYFFNASLRADGSSRFAKGNRWGTFGAVSAAWNITKESFMEDVTWLKNLKLKASWGVTGNQSLSSSAMGSVAAAYYPYSDIYTIRNLNDAPSFTFSSKGNKNLTWEKTYNTNIGLEFNIANVLEGEINYFNRLTTNMLFNKSVAISQGYSTIPVNDGKMRNAGVELNFLVHAINKKDVSLDIRLNAAHYKNTIVELPMDEVSGERMHSYTYSTRYTWTKGRSMYDFYLPTYMGVDEETGISLFKTVSAYDADGNLVQENITDMETFKHSHEGEQLTYEEGTTTKWSQAVTDYVGKSSVPALTGGFGFDFRYKDFTFGTTFTYSLGGYAYDYTYALLMGDDAHGSTNWHKDIEKRWQNAGDKTDVPALTNGSSAGTYANARSTRFLTSRSYLQLSSVRLGYNIPDHVTSRLAGLHGVQIYATGENLFLLSARKGFMPGTSLNGQSNDYQYLPSSSFTVGLKFNF